MTSRSVSFIDGTHVAAPCGDPGLSRARVRAIVSSVICAVLVAGCGAAYIPSPLPVNHPASPAAPEAPPPLQALGRESVLRPSPKDVSAQKAPLAEGAMHGGH